MRGREGWPVRIAPVGHPFRIQGRIAVVLASTATFAVTVGLLGFIAIGSMRLAGIAVDCNSCVMVSFCALMIGVLAAVGALMSGVPIT